MIASARPTTYAQKRLPRLAGRVGAEGVGAAGAAQLVERVALELAHGLAAGAQPAGDLVERSLVSIGQAEPELYDPPLTRLQRAQRIVHLVLQVGHQRSRSWGFRHDVFDQVAELGVALLPDRRLQRDRVSRGLPERLDLDLRQPKLLADLLVGRVAPERL